MLRHCLFILLASVLTSSCAQQQQQQRGLPPLPRKTAAVIGNMVWQNECAGTVKGLVSWNVGESFPSLGIAHFIWFPRGVRPPFKESWPSFVQFAEERGVRVPSYLKGAAPWSNRSAFLADRSGKADKMRAWLSQNLGLQTAFLIRRSRAALPSMMKASKQPSNVAARYYALARTARGNYCLIDYVNFKGEGLTMNERYNGTNWGLLQVLEEMRGRPQGSAATAEFSRAASVVLQRRVRNAPPSRGESRWLAGWMKRCRSYKG